jgi:hypothetical protein
VGGVNIDAKLSATCLDTLLGIEKLSIDVPYGHRVEHRPSGDTICQRIIVAVETGEEKSVELRGAKWLSDR